jgi:adenylate cyclase
VIASQTGRHGIAICHTSKAIEAEPGLSEAHNNLGNTLQKLGRVVDSSGDNPFAEFGSVVCAVESAVEIQLALKEQSAALSVGRRMEFRFGVNPGDVVVEKDRLYGDGVNIAVRLEGLAKGGGLHLERRLPPSEK